MKQTFFSRASAIALTAVAVLLVAKKAEAGCMPPGQTLSPQDIRIFLNNPTALLSNQGGNLVKAVRLLIGSDREALPAVIQLAQAGDADQKAAIAAGVATAALICVKSEPTYASEIQQAVALSNDSSFILAFAGVAGDQPIGSVSGIGGASGASGGQVNALAGGRSINSSNPTTGSSGFRNGFVTYFNGASTGAVGGINITTNNLAGSVSP